MENTFNNEAINEEVINEEVTEVTEISDPQVENDEPKQDKSLLTGIIGVGAVVGAGYGLYRLGKKVCKTTKTFVKGGIKAIRDNAADDDEPEQETATDIDTGEEIPVEEVTEEKPKAKKKESK